MRASLSGVTIESDLTSVFRYRQSVVREETGNFLNIFPESLCFPHLSPLLPWGKMLLHSSNDAHVLSLVFPTTAPPVSFILSRFPSKHGGLFYEAFQWMYHTLPFFREKKYRLTLFSVMVSNSSHWVGIMCLCFLRLRYMLFRTYCSRIRLRPVRFSWVLATSALSRSSSSRTRPSKPNHQNKDVFSR